MPVGQLPRGRRQGKREGMQLAKDLKADQTLGSLRYYNGFRCRLFTRSPRQRVYRWIAARKGFPRGLVDHVPIGAILDWSRERAIDRRQFSRQ
jgi:hypothetical protein